MHLTISIVSHGQSTLVDKLLRDIDEKLDFRAEDVNIVLTCNIPEENWRPYSRKFNVTRINNIISKGFGANHNSAFKLAKDGIFIVCNPDIKLTKTISSTDFAEAYVNKGIFSPQILDSEYCIADFIPEPFARFV